MFAAPSFSQPYYQRINMSETSNLKDTLESLAEAAERKQREFNEQLAREQEFARIKKEAEAKQPAAKPDAKPEPDAKPDAKPEPPSVMFGNVFEVAAQMSGYLCSLEDDSEVTIRLHGHNAQAYRAALAHFDEYVRKAVLKYHPELLHKDEQAHMVGYLCHKYIIQAIEERLEQQTKNGVGALIMTPDDIKNILKPKKGSN
jgi:hypothetical protein